MRLLSIGVRSFGCIEEAKLELRPGLNVLYGPNDLGKSTLVHAIRAALLLPTSRREAERFRPWHRDVTPEVTLAFEAPDEPGSDRPPRIWRVRKSFGAGRKGSAELHWSNDGEHFSVEQKGDGVDDKLRTMLGWGVPGARARGPRGFPSSFLTTVLLGPQAVPGSMLGNSLDDDPTDSGRERLTEALQALAQDPRFKEILDEAQRKVDEAFTPTGKPRKGKASPLSPIKQRIRELSEELRLQQERVHDSDDVRQQLLALDLERIEAVAARDDAEKQWQRQQALFERGRQRAEALAQVQEAREALERGQAVLADRRTWQEAVERHMQGRPAAEGALLRAGEVEQAAAQTFAEAEAHLRAIEQGGDAEAKLERQQLETRRLQLKAEHAQVHERLRLAEEALEKRAEVETVAEARDALAQDLAASERAATDAEAVRREADAEQRLYDAALRLRRYEEAEQRVAHAQEAEAEANRSVEEAEKLEAQAQAIDEAVAAEALPEPSEIDGWRALAEERRIAQARLEVGLSVVVHGTPPAQVQARADDGAEAVAEPGQAIEAQRRLSLAMGPDLRIEIEGGDASARATRDALEQRWVDEVAPVLVRVEVEDLAGLRARMDSARQRQAEARQLRDKAVSTRQLAEARRERAVELPALREALQASQNALAGLDRALLQERTGDYDETELRRRQAHAQARVDEARHTHAQAKSRSARLESQKAAQTERHDRLAAELATVLARLPGSPVSERDTAFDRLAALEGEIETVDAELAEHDEARARRRSEAEAAVNEAQTQVDQARLATSLARRELDERKEALAQAEGRHAQLESQAAQIDEAALKRELEERQAALSERPEPQETVSAESLAEGERAWQQQQQALREIEAALEQQRGALKQVGGAVAREEAERTREALEATKQAEHDLELDYEAWRLLAQTLREAETAEGRHLGEALGEPVHERFAQLTGERYGALSLGRDLQAGGLEVAGELRDVKALSEGVQDQLATILRLAVAEQLGSALVLDDHLVQTDPARIAWFRELLVDVGQRAQILVLTCRPEDYLGADERPAEGEASRDSDAVRAVSLASVIRRAGST